MFASSISATDVQAEIEASRKFQEAREARALVKETFLALLTNPATVSLEPTAILDRAEQLALAYQQRRPRISYHSAVAQKPAVPAGGR